MRDLINAAVKDGERVFRIDIGPDVKKITVERDEAGVELSDD